MRNRMFDAHLDFLTAGATTVDPLTATSFMADLKTQLKQAFSMVEPNRQITALLPAIDVSAHSLFSAMNSWPKRDLEAQRQDFIDQIEKLRDAMNACEPSAKAVNSDCLRGRF